MTCKVVIHKVGSTHLLEDSFMSRGWLNSLQHVAVFMINNINFGPYLDCFGQCAHKFVIILNKSRLFVYNHIVKFTLVTRCCYFKIGYITVDPNDIIVRL